MQTKLKKGIAFSLETQNQFSCATTDTLYNTMCAKFKLNVYPNPTSGIFNLYIGSQIEEQFTYKVTNSLGQLILSEKMDANNTQNIDLSGNSAGVYFVTIQGANGIKTEKIILQK